MSFESECLECLRCLEPSGSLGICVRKHFPEKNSGEIPKQRMIAANIMQLTP